MVETRRHLVQVQTLPILLDKDLLNLKLIVEVLRSDSLKSIDQPVKDQDQVLVDLYLSSEAVSTSGGPLRNEQLNKQLSLSDLLSSPALFHILPFLQPLLLLLLLANLVHSRNPLSHCRILYFALFVFLTVTSNLPFFSRYSEACELGRDHWGTGTVEHSARLSPVLFCSIESAPVFPLMYDLLLAQRRIYCCSFSTAENSLPVNSFAFTSSPECILSSTVRKASDSFTSVFRARQKCD